MHFWQEQGGFGEDKADYRSGLLASVIANVNGAKRADKKPFQPSDFMPFAKSKKKARKGPGLKQVFTSLIGGDSGKKTDGRKDNGGEGG